ncbi:MAG: hypothetical protein HY261_05170, partial [Chloroflexi bacterium]|nr:hypothetical protein [Chloroflexota bacterium]
AGDAHFTNYVAIRFTAGSVNVVVRSSGTQPFRVYATIDGSPLPATVLGGDMAPDEQGRTYVTVDQPRLYNVYKGPLSTHDLKLYPVSNDFLLYTYTFGG